MLQGSIADLPEARGCAVLPIYLSPIETTHFEFQALILNLRISTANLQKALHARTIA